MELKNYIERAEKAVGSQKELGVILGQSAGKLRQAKSGICGLPVSVCYQIANLIGEDERVVVAASELVTEKKPERRAVLLPFVQHALSVLIVMGAATVTTVVTPSPANAIESTQRIDNTVYYVK